MPKTQLSTVSIYQRLECFSTENNIGFSPEIKSSIDNILNVVAIRDNGKVWFKGSASTEKMNTILSELNLIIANAHKLISLEFIKILNLEDILNLDDEISQLKGNNWSITL